MKLLRSFSEEISQNFIFKLGGGPSESGAEIASKALQAKVELADLMKEVAGELPKRTVEAVNAITDGAAENTEIAEAEAALSEALETSFEKTGEKVPGPADKVTEAEVATVEEKGPGFLAGLASLGGAFGDALRGSGAVEATYTETEAVMGMSTASIEAAMATYDA